MGGFGGAPKVVRGFSWVGDGKKTVRARARARWGIGEGLPNELSVRGLPHIGARLCLLWVHVWAWICRCYYEMVTKNENEAKLKTRHSCSL